MKKYLIVCWSHYEGSDGLGNIKATFDTLIECGEYIEKSVSDLEYLYNVWIYDRDTMEVIKKIKTE